MDALSNIDRFVALLRLKLAARARAQLTKAAPSAAAPKAAAENPQLRIATLAAQRGLEECSLKRAVIEQLLAERLGNELANEPRFQQIVEQVTNIIADDAELAALFGEILREAHI